jgi:hypothetical protein
MVGSSDSRNVLLKMITEYSLDTLLGCLGLPVQT